MRSSVIENSGKPPMLAHAAVRRTNSLPGHHAALMRLSSDPVSVGVCSFCSSFCLFEALQHLNSQLCWETTETESARLAASHAVHPESDPHQRQEREATKKSTEGMTANHLHWHDGRCNEYDGVAAPEAQVCCEPCHLLSPQEIATSKLSNS